MEGKKGTKQGREEDTNIRQSKKGEVTNQAGSVV